MKLIKRRVWILVVISILTIAIIMALGIILNNIAIKQLVKSIDENDQSKFDFWINIPYNLNSDGLPSFVCSMTETSFCTPLQKACYNGNHDMIYKLLEHGANANYYESNYNTPLMAVVQSTRNTRNASIQLLLNSGADPNQITPDQRSVVTVLLETKFKESEQVFDLLIANGLDINKEYTRGTALYIACRYRRSDMITYLLPISDVNYQNEYGVTCLMIYLKSKKDIKPKANIVKAIIEGGANLSLKDNEHKSVLDYALATENQEIIDLIVANNNTGDGSGRQGDGSLVLTKITTTQGG